MRTASTLEVVPDSPRLDPAWDQARAHLAAGRRAARALAAEIERLRGVFEHGGARKGSSSHVVNLNTGAGFVAQLEAQLGLHPEQARRICEAAEYQKRIEQIAKAEIGDRVTWEEKSGPKSVQVTERRRTLAQLAVDGWSLPAAPKPSRSWAGILSGDGTRPGKNKGNGDRADIDHGRNLRRALIAMANSLEHWTDITSEERQQIESAWSEMVDAGIIPSTWKRL